MALIIETGAPVANANSYAEWTDLTAYAAARGISVPNTQGACEILLLKAMDYLESIGWRYVGVRTFVDSSIYTQLQSLQWPRDGLVLDGLAFPNNMIPPQLVQAQIILAIAAQTIDLLPAVAGQSRVARRQTVGPITVEYADNGSNAYLQPVISQANALLRQLFGTLSSPMQFRTIKA